MQTEDIDQLQSLNTLFALATGSSSGLADQIRNAINFTAEEVDPTAGSYQSFARSAEKLLALHLQGNTSCGFEHCDLRDQKDDPLFLRGTVLKSLRLLSGNYEAILLVTGLRQLVCPPKKYWTKARKERYRELLSYIEELAAYHSSPRTHLKIITL